MTHKYTLFGYNIVIDTESGAVHVLSDIAMKLIDYLESMIIKENTENENNKNNVGFSGFPQECPLNIRYYLAKYESSQVQEAYAELCGLYRDKMLFTHISDVSNISNISNISNPADVKSRDTNNFNENPVKALCLNISHDCNMMCEYCFAGNGDETGKGQYGLEKNFMSEETGMNAVKFLLQNSGSRKNLEVDFFGGEPLMNFEAVKNIVLKTRVLEKDYNKNVRFTLTTNGTLLDDEKINFINSNISNIVLSLDGLPVTNDKMRRYNGGGGVYEDIVPMYQKLVEKRLNSNSPFKDYYIRGTFTRNNLDFAKDVIHMADLGFKNVSVEPVVAGDDTDYSIRREDLPIVFKEYENLAREIIRRNKNQKNQDETLNFFHFNIDLENGPCVYKRIKGCGSGSEYLAVIPNGDIYPCHQFVGNGQFKLGNVNANIGNIKLDMDLMKKFFANNIIENENCGKCWVKYFCGGGCPANNYKFNGDIYAPYSIACEMEKKRVECAIAIKAALNQ